MFCGLTIASNRALRVNNTAGGPGKIMMLIQWKLLEASSSQAITKLRQHNPLDSAVIETNSNDPMVFDVSNNYSRRWHTCTRRRTEKAVTSVSAAPTQVPCMVSTRLGGTTTIIVNTVPGLCTTSNQAEGDTRGGCDLFCTYQRITGYVRRGPPVDHVLEGQAHAYLRYKSKSAQVQTTL